MLLFLNGYSGVVAVPLDKVFKIELADSIVKIRCDVGNFTDAQDGSVFSMPEDFKVHYDSDAAAYWAMRKFYEACATGKTVFSFKGSFAVNDDEVGS